MAHHDRQFALNYTREPPGDAVYGIVRQRQAKKDECIRKRIERDLGKKISSGRIRFSVCDAGKDAQSMKLWTALQPGPALTVAKTMFVNEMAQCMADQRSDCAVVVNDDGQMCGFCTTTDLATRVLAGKLDPRMTRVADVMTETLDHITMEMSLDEVIDRMVSQQQSYLPMCDENQRVCGIVDLAQCLHDIVVQTEGPLSSTNTREVEQGPDSSEDGMSTTPIPSVVWPDLTALQSEHARSIQVPLKANVRQVAKLMKRHRTTSVAVVENGRVVGTFTAKDAVLRVIAAGVAPETCSVVRVMTPQPDTVPVSMRVDDALKTMQVNGSHHLVIAAAGNSSKVVGVVDILCMVQVILEQTQGSVNSGRSFGESPTWPVTMSNQSRGSTETVEPSTATSSTPHPAEPYADTVISRRESSLTVEDDQSTSTSCHCCHQATTSTVFKFHHDGQTHRLRSDLRFHRLRAHIVDRLALWANVDSFSLAYADEEDDWIVMTCDADVLDAVQLARRRGHHVVHLQVNMDPKDNHISLLTSVITQWAMPAGISLASMALANFIHRSMRRHRPIR